MLANIGDSGSDVSLEGHVGDVIEWKPELKSAEMRTGITKFAMPV